MNQEETVEAFVEAVNAFDVDRAVALFADQAVIDDESVGTAFRGTEGVRRYLASYFVGYHTKTTLVSVTRVGPQSLQAQVDFVGDFGHETGGLRFTFDGQGLVQSIDAHLD